MRLPDDRPAVLVSLPRNDARLAEAAIRGGADGLKVHINVEHRASGTIFRSLADEAVELRQIVRLGMPTGLAVGAAGTVSLSEVRVAVSWGFDFFDAYAAHAPEGYVDACGKVTAMLAVGPNDPPGTAARLVDLGVQAIEASTLDPALYGTELSIGSVATIMELKAAVSVPLIVPTQHRLTVDDAHRLADVGVEAILLGAVVTGTEPDSIEKATHEFATALR